MPNQISGKRSLVWPRRHAGIISECPAIDPHFLQRIQRQDYLSGKGTGTYYVGSTLNLMSIWQINRPDSMPSMIASWRSHKSHHSTKDTILWLAICVGSAGSMHVAEGASNTTEPGYANVDPMMPIHFATSLCCCRCDVQFGERRAIPMEWFIFCSQKKEQTWAPRTEALFSHFEIKDAALILLQI